MENPRHLRRQGKIEQSEATKRLAIKRQLRKMGFMPIPSISGSLHNLRQCREQVFAVLSQNQGTIMGYQAFAGALLALGVFALSHGAFALAISFFAGWR